MKATKITVLAIAITLSLILVPLLSAAAVGSVPRPGQGVQKKQERSPAKGVSQAGNKKVDKQKYSPSFIIKSFYAASELYDAYKNDDITDAWSFTRSVIMSSIVYNDASAIVGPEKWSKAAHLCLTEQECKPAFEILEAVYGDFEKSKDSDKAENGLILTPYHVFAVIITEELIYKIKYNIKFAEVLAEAKENGKLTAPPAASKGGGVGCFLTPSSGGGKGGAGGSECSTSSFSDSGPGGDPIKSWGQMSGGGAVPEPSTIDPNTVKTPMDIKKFFMEDCPLDISKLPNVGGEGEGAGGEPEGGDEPADGKSPDEKRKDWEKKVEAELKHMQDNIEKWESEQGSGKGPNSGWPGRPSTEDIGNDWSRFFDEGINVGDLTFAYTPSNDGNGGGGVGGPAFNSHHVNGIAGVSNEVYSYNDKIGIVAGFKLKLTFKPRWDADSAQSVCGKSGSGGLSGFFGRCIQGMPTDGFLPGSNERVRVCPYCDPMPGDKMDQPGGSGPVSSTYNMLGNNMCWLWIRYGGVFDPMPEDPGTGVGEGNKEKEKCNPSGLGSVPMECCIKDPSLPGCGGDDPVYQDTTLPKEDH